MKKLSATILSGEARDCENARPQALNEQDAFRSSAKEAGFRIKPGMTEKKRA
jgi:hypothetical protein